MPPQRGNPPGDDRDHHAHATDLRQPHEHDDKDHDLRWIQVERLERTVQGIADVPAD
jgi:hypothetical protein